MVLLRITTASLVFFSAAAKKQATNQKRQREKRVPLDFPTLLIHLRRNAKKNILYKTFRPSALAEFFLPLNMIQQGFARWWKCWDDITWFRDSDSVVRISHPIRRPRCHHEKSAAFVGSYIILPWELSYILMQLWSGRPLIWLRFAFFCMAYVPATNMIVKTADMAAATVRI